MAFIHETGSGPDHHAEEDENYFISMTDMMVGILFIFIIMLMVFALNFKQQTDVSVEQIERLEQARRQAEIVADKLDALKEEVRLELQQIDKSDQVRSALLQEIRTRLAAQGLDVEIDLANGVLRLTEDAVRFPTSSPILNDLASANVRKIALVLREVLPSFASCAVKEASCSRDPKATSVETVFIEGHTDVTGADEANWQLSTQRAVNTYRLMTEAQPLLRSLTNRAARQIVSVSGYSSTRPVIDEKNSVAYDTNRRIDLRFVMEVDDGKRLREVLELTNKMEGQLKNLRSAIDAADVQ
ncbi:flagellar motor protein MotB [Phyllobacterium sp. 1468]|jgi:flagellar motor protein MotB|uniref:OmpA/MotB family protein n=1 Tax=Phyllobacterium sp. 1468 TaxID=2817759 RepID=UPI00285883B7|nr:OmpA family protein [Phyllobacterium sp. 1468]MDR6632307.1 flagellar motor protein MotB [Phyllobacterium sp. 1468]